MSDDDTEKWWAEHAGDASVTATRAHIFDTVAAHLREIADRPIAWRRDGVPAETGTARYRSIVMRVAQYWNDQADDECHLEIIGSGSDDPTGLHACSYDETPAGDDACGMCSSEDGIRDEYDVVRSGYGSLIPAVEAFCAEGASQNMDSDACYRPLAVARVVGTEGAIDVAVDVVGALVRPWLDLPTSHPPRLPVVPDRVLALAGDPDARTILADALQEAADPRGDALAHGTFGYELGRTWLGALGPHVPRSALGLVGGVPDSIGLYLDREPGDDVRAERLPFAFRPAVRFLPQSRRAIWPALAPARSLGPLDAPALAQLAKLNVPFFAEELELELSSHRELGDLLEVFAHARRQLPHLRLLRLAGAGVAHASAGLMIRARLARLPERLEVTTVAEDLAEHVAEIAAWHRSGPIAVAMYDREAHRAAGWIALPGGSIARRGFHRHASLERRDALVGMLR